MLEVQKKDGSVYPANTLHHLCCGVMRHLQEYGRHELDIFKDPAFAEFQATLDAEMKRIQLLGIRSKKKKQSNKTVQRIIGSFMMKDNFGIVFLPFLVPLGDF